MAWDAAAMSKSARSTTRRECTDLCLTDKAFSKPASWFGDLSCRANRSCTGFCLLPAPSSTLHAQNSVFDLAYDNSGSMSDSPSVSCGRLS